MGKNKGNLMAPMTMGQVSKPVNVNSAEGKRMAAAAAARKAEAQKLVGTTTPGGQPIRNIQEALKIHDTLQKEKKGVVSGSK
jgi:hypothetical protein